MSGRSPVPPGACPATDGRGQGHMPFQSPAWQAFVMNFNLSVPDRTGPCLDTSSKCWTLDDDHYGEVHAVCAFIQTDDPGLSVKRPTYTDYLCCRRPRTLG